MVGNWSFIGIALESHVDIHWIFRGAVFGGRWSFIRFFTGYVVFFTGAGLPALERRKHWSFMGMTKSSPRVCWTFMGMTKSSPRVCWTLGVLLLRNGQGVSWELRLARCFCGASLRLVGFRPGGTPRFLARQGEAHVLAPGLGSRLCGGSVGKGRRLLNILRGRGGQTKPLCFPWFNCKPDRPGGLDWMGLGGKSVSEACTCHSN